MKTIRSIILAGVLMSVLASCDAIQSAVETASPKADKIIGIYGVSHAEYGSLAFNYPGKYSYKNNASVASPVMLSMSLKIDKFNDEEIGVGLAVEHELGQSPSFSADANTVRRVSLSHEPDRTVLLDKDSRKQVGYIKSNILTLNYTQNNTQVFLTANKL